MIRIDDRYFDVDAVVFDKDGTLIEMDPLWIGIARRWLARITEEVGHPQLVAELRTALDIDEAGRLLPNGVAHSGTIAEAVAVATAVLSRAGADASEERVYAALAKSRGFDPADIVPLGDVAGTIERLRRADIGVAVATSDDRHPTEQQLALLGIAPSVDLIVAADDDAIEPKPSTQVLDHVADSLGVATGRMVMIGDSSIDMQTGRNGGALACIGITGDGGNPDGADLTIDTIDRIVAGQPR